jgi:hypothetical protein
MPVTKVCKQCGAMKPLDQFRKYYGGRKGTYKVCITCERLNSREKYLASKIACNRATEVEKKELTTIHQIWDDQATLGLRPPRKMSGKSTPLDVDAIAQVFRGKAQAVKPTGIPEHTPAELVGWLTAPLTESPEYYQDVIYEQLREKYRPVLSIDPNTLLPVYDDTYKSVLNGIADRFDNYEDHYYDEE